MMLMMTTIMLDHDHGDVNIDGDGNAAPANDDDDGDDVVLMIMATHPPEHWPRLIGALLDPNY